MSVLRKFIIAALALASLAVAAGANAAKESYVTLGAGIYDFDINFTNFNDDDQASFEYRLEYRGSEFWHGLLPTFGVNSNIDGGTFAFIGLAYDFQINNSFYILPSFAPGYYYEGGSKDLGGELEFRSSLEVGYQMQNKSRLGLNISHISNAGIYERNPGVNSLVATYSMPFNYFTQP